MNKNVFCWVLISIFLILGILIFFYGEDFNFFDKSFNFYKSEININGDIVSEKLFFIPNQNYHTLFRTFTSGFEKDESSEVIIKDVKCSSGDAYFVGRDSSTYIFSPEMTSSNSLSYTEKNEYGCTFGSVYGFNEGEEYWISASYKLNPQNLVMKDGKKQIKFVAYSSSNHKKLVLGKNLFISGNYSLLQNSFSSNDEVVIYLPVSENDSRNILYDEKRNSTHLILALFCFLPSIALFFGWFFTRGKSPSIGLNYSSTYPQEREGWEVASYFQPPFRFIGSNFFSAIFLELFFKKAIDIKVKDKKTFVLLKSPSKLDEVETDFYNLLKLKKENSKLIDSEGYFDLSQRFSFSPNYVLQNASLSLQKKINSLRKSIYSLYAGSILSAYFILFFIGVIIFSKELGGSYLLVGSFYLLGIFSMIVAYVLGIFTLFKGNYYTEYTHWQAFKNFLASSDSIKNADERATILWDKYLVYAAALNIPKKVIDKWKDMGYISDVSYNSYNASFIVSASFVSSPAGGFSGGGISGGGVGGGGGGGR